MRVWSSTNIRKEIEETRDNWKPKVEKTRITTNKHGVHILWIDEKSAKKYWCGK